MNKQDYLSYYKTSDLTGIITDSKISKTDLKMLEEYTSLIL